MEGKTQSQEVTRVNKQRCVYLACENFEQNTLDFVLNKTSCFRNWYDSQSHREGVQGRRRRESYGKGREAKPHRDEHQKQATARGAEPKIPG